MFWGLIMEPQRRYTQQVKKAFHISMASLDISTSSEEPAQVMCSFEGRNYLLCTLRKPDVLQCPLDLNFEVGSELSFAANGKCHVHLTGYLIDEPISDDLDGLEEEEEDVEEDETVVNNKKRSKKEQKNGPPAKKNKGNNAKKSDADSDSDEDSDESDVDIKEFLEKSLADSEDDTTFKSEDQDEESGEEEEDDDEDIEEEEEDDVEGEEDEEEESSLSEAESEEEKEVPSPKKKNKQVNGIAKPDQTKSKKDKNQQPQEQKEKGKKEGTSPAPKKKVLNGGVIIEDIKEGDGAPAKAGKFVTVYYEGRLKQNNKVFDSTRKGAGFSFRLGAGEVIKGWDVGVVGMKPGSKRRIICPPAMAYGQKGSPPAIPANSTLVFEVELKKIR